MLRQQVLHLQPQQQVLETRLAAGVGEDVGAVEREGGEERSFEGFFFNRNVVLKQRAASGVCSGSGRI